MIPDIPAFNMLGLNIKAQSVGVGLLGSTASNTLTSQRLALSAIYMSISDIISGVKWYQSTQGSFTANNFNGLGLYSYANGVLTLIAQTANNGSTWQTPGSNTFASALFTSPVALAPGIYFVGAIYSQSAVTTAPVITSSTALANLAIAQMGTNSGFTAGFLASQTSLPASINASACTATTQNNWFALF
jgi:hypothetical protein